MEYPARDPAVPLTREQATDLVGGGLTRLSYHEDPVTGRSVYPKFEGVDRVRVRLALQPKGAETVLTVRLRTVGGYRYDSGKSRKSEWTFRQTLHPAYLEPQDKPSDPLDSVSRQLTRPLVFPSSPIKRQPGVPDEIETHFEEALEQIARLTSYAVLADGYQTGALYGPLIREPGPKALSYILERLCSYGRRSCRLNGAYLLLRHAKWPQARAAEPPARAARRWEASIRRYGCLRFADTVQIVGGLTDEQAETFETELNWTEPAGIARLLEADREQSAPVLRLLHSLPAHLRKSLENGAQLPLKVLPAGCVRHVQQAFLEATDRMSGHEGFDYPGGQVYVPGSGFAREDQLEMLWQETRISLHRKPQEWVITGYSFDLIENAEQRKQLLEDATKDPVDDKPRVIQGELVEVIFSVPGAEPVRHFFLNPTRELPEDRG